MAIVVILRKNSLIIIRTHEYNPFNYCRILCTFSSPMILDFFRHLSTTLRNVFARRYLIVLPKSQRLPFYFFFKNNRIRAIALGLSRVLLRNIALFHLILL